MARMNKSEFNKMGLKTLNHNQTVKLVSKVVHGQGRGVEHDFFLEDVCTVLIVSYRSVGGTNTNRIQIQTHSGFKEFRMKS